MQKKPERPAATKIIMGIDPGTNYTGYGILEVRGNAPKCLVLGYIQLVKLTDPYEKLKRIFERVGMLIEEYAPDEVALESPFFGDNVQSMLKLGRAQGVAMAAALTRGVPVFEYAPRRIKQSITGSGAASKEQVAAMLQRILNVEYSLKKLDATDGLAVALCHHFESSSAIKAASGSGRKNALGGGLKSLSRGGSSSWEDFLSKNPGRELKSEKKKPAK